MTPPCTEGCRVGFDIVEGLIVLPSFVWGISTGPPYPPLLMVEVGEGVTSHLFNNILSLLYRDVQWGDISRIKAKGT